MIKIGERANRAGSLFSLLAVLREVWPWGSLLRQKQLGD
jgi:hypothetical protein